jgi:LysM repeat protein
MSGGKHTKPGLVIQAIEKPLVSKGVYVGSFVLLVLAVIGSIFTSPHSAKAHSSTPSIGAQMLASSAQGASTLHASTLQAESIKAWQHPPKAWTHPVAPKPVVVTYPYTYVVATHDTLSSIAQKAYGRSDAWTLIYFQNHLKSVTIMSGSHLTIVKLVGQPPSPPAPPKASDSTGPGVVQSPAPVSSPAPVGSLQAYAQSLFGSQYSCIASVINVESGWQVEISNRFSGAYGIPQALPGSKMASAGADWATNGYTQLRWMKSYVDGQYGGACGAWAHEQSAGWY